MQFCVIDLDQGDRSVSAVPCENAGQTVQQVISSGIDRKAAMDVLEADVLDALETVIDPELGMNIVDLGLVYEVLLEHGAASISMTMTTPACPLASHLVDQVKTTLSSRFPALQSIDVQLVWEPAWNPLMMSWKVREQFGWT